MCGKVRPVQHAVPVDASDGRTPLRRRRPGALPDDAARIIHYMIYESSDTRDLVILSSKVEPVPSAAEVIGDRLRRRAARSL